MKLEGKADAVNRPLNYYLLLNRTRSTEYSMNINKLRNQLTRANVRNDVIQFVAR